MRQRFIPVLFAMTLVLAFLLTGCSPKSPSGPQASAAGPASAAPASGATAPGSTAAPDGSPAASGNQSSPPASPNAPVDCNWTMFVEQTIPKTVDGLIVNYELMLVAQKSGGKDVNGTYKGVAYVGINFDASQMNTDVLKMLGGFNVNAYTYDLTFDVVGWDNETYSGYGQEGDLPPLLQLVQYQSMALVTPQMTGTGTLDTSITGIQGEHGGKSDSNSGSTSVAMRITVDDGKVQVDIPSFQLSHRFEGMLTGVPIDGSSPDDQIQQATDQIQTLMDQAAAEASAAASGVDLGSLIDQFKPKS